MGRARKFYFAPLVAKVGRKKDERQPYVRIGKSGVVTLGKDTLEKLNLNRPMFYRLYQDASHRAVGIHFSEHESLTGDTGWKAWTPKTYKNATFAQFSIKSFIENLADTVLPSKRLPLEKYNDSDMQLEYHYFVIPRGEADPEDGKFK